MATSDVELVSNALRLIGDDPITALSDNSERARLANAFYTPTLDELLRQQNWNFAQKRVTLVELATAPVWDFAHQFQLPENPYCLYVLETSLGSDEPWRLEGRALVTDASSVSILYVARITDVTVWDGLFAEAFTYELAFKFSYPLTRNAQLSEVLQRESEKKFQRAKSRDGQEARMLKKFLSSSLTQVR